MFFIVLLEEFTDDIAEKCVEKGLLNDLMKMVQSEGCVSKVAQLLAEVAKTGKASIMLFLTADWVKSSLDHVRR